MKRLKSVFARCPTIILFATLATLLSGCARSEEDIRQEFDEIVLESSSCASADECTLVVPGCPLGCFVAVNIDEKSYVEDKARELIDSYEVGGQACQYDCLAPGPVACVDGHCTVEPE